MSQCVKHQSSRAQVDDKCPPKTALIEARRFQPRLVVFWCFFLVLFWCRFRQGVLRRVSYQECPTRLSHENVPQECLRRVSHKSFPQSVLQECSQKSATAKVSLKDACVAAHPPIQYALDLINSRQAICATSPKQEMYLELLGVEKKKKASKARASVFW